MFHVKRFALLVAYEAVLERQVERLRAANVCAQRAAEHRRLARIQQMQVFRFKHDDQADESLACSAAIRKT